MLLYGFSELGAVQKRSIQCSVLRIYCAANEFSKTVSIVLSLSFRWSMTPLMYPSSFYFEVPSTAYIVLISANLFVGVIGTIATFILDFFGTDDIVRYFWFQKNLWLLFYVQGKSIVKGILMVYPSSSRT